MGERFKDDLGFLSTDPLTPRRKSKVVKKAEEQKMKDKFTAHLIHDDSHKKTNVYLELTDKPDTFLLADNTGTEERKMGEEMPLYASFPDEILAPILRTVGGSLEAAGMR